MADNALSPLTDRELETLDDLDLDTLDRAALGTLLERIRLGTTPLRNTCCGRRTWRCSTTSSTS